MYPIYCFNTDKITMVQNPMVYNTSGPGTNYVIDNAQWTLQIGNTTINCNTQYRYITQNAAVYRGGASFYTNNTKDLTDTSKIKVYLNNVANYTSNTYSTGWEDVTQYFTINVNNNILKLTQLRTMPFKPTDSYNIYYVSINEEINTNVPVTYTLTFTNTLCDLDSSTPNLSPYEENTQFTLTFKARSTSPRVGFKSNSVTNTTGINNLSTTVSIDGLTITVTGTIIANASFTITAEPLASGNININIILTRATVDASTPLQDPYSLNETVKFIFHTDPPASNITTFFDNLFSYAGFINATTEISADKQTITFQGTINSTIVNIYAQANFYCKIHLTGTFTNCNVNYNDNADILPTQPLVISAIPSYNFKGSAYYISDRENPSELQDGSYVPTMVDNLIFGANNTTLTYNPYTEVLGYNLYLFDTYTATKIISNIDGFVNLFAPTTQNLIAIGRLRYFQVQYGSGVYTGEIFDYGQFILDLYSVPFSIENLLGDSDEVILGNLKTNVQATRLNDYNLTVTGGNIAVTAPYNNVYDYLDTETLIYLPYFGSITLDPQLVIGYIINITYKLDLYSGSLTVDLKSNAVNDLIYSNSTNIALRFPITQRSQDSTVNSLTNASQSWQIETAYITVLRNIPYDTTTEFGHGVKQYTELKNATGYNVINEINLVSNATENEKNEIVSLLQDGIFINDTT